MRNSIEGIKFFILAGFVILSLAGCSSPRLDASNEEALSKSIAEVSNSLEGKDRERFNKAAAEASIATAMTKAMGAGEISSSTIWQRMNGKTGKEIIVELDKIEAEKIAKDKARLKELDSKQSLYLAEMARWQKAVLVTSPEISIKETLIMKLYMLTVRVENKSEVPLSSISFRYELRTPGRSIPWDDGIATVRFAGGLEKNESRRDYSMDDSMSMIGFPSLHIAKAKHPEAELHISLADVFGADGESLFKAEPLTTFEQTEAKRLQGLMGVN